jgi:GNAT superfamily N-acetyltransferase
VVIVTFKPETYPQEFDTAVHGIPAGADGVRVLSRDEDGEFVEGVRDGWSAAVSSRNGEVDGILIIDGNRTLLAVGPESQGRGVATALLEAIAPVKWMKIGPVWSLPGLSVVRKFITKYIAEPWMDKWTCEELMQHKPGCSCAGEELEGAEDEPDPTAWLGDGPDGVTVVHRDPDGTISLGLGGEDALWVASVERMDGRVLAYLKISLNEEGSPAETTTLWSDTRGGAFRVLRGMAVVRKIVIDQIYSPEGASVVSEFIAQNYDQPWADKWTCEELGHHRTGCGHERED